MERKHDVKFFVYIIESPSASDFYNGMSEGELIVKAVSLNDIPSFIKVVVSKDTFLEALSEGVYSAMLLHPDRLPIVHLSAHGSTEGIQLTDNTVFSWEELKAILKPVNKAFRERLLLCMSSCEGLNAFRMAMQKEPVDLPFWGLVGNEDKPLWSETAVAYATFYHQLAMGEILAESVEKMKKASGNNEFKYYSSNEIRKAYIDVVKEMDIGQAQNTLEENIEKKRTRQATSVKKENIK